MIDKLYAREKRYVYVKQNQREECLSHFDIIFNLHKCHDLKQMSSVLQQAEQLQRQKEQCMINGVPMSLDIKTQPNKDLQK